MKVGVLLSNIYDVFYSSFNLALIISFLNIYGIFLDFSLESFLRMANLLNSVFEAFFVHLPFLNALNKLNCVFC